MHSSPAAIPRGRSGSAAARRRQHAAATGRGRPGRAQPAARVEPGLTLDVEGFCSETRLRTSNARITWRAQRPLSPASPASARRRSGSKPPSSRAASRKDSTWRCRLATPPRIADRGHRPGPAGVAGWWAAQQTLTRRAFQIRLIQVNAARVSAAAADSAEWRRWSRTRARRQLHVADGGRCRSRTRGVALDLPARAGLPGRHGRTSSPPDTAAAAMTRATTWMRRRC